MFNYLFCHGIVQSNMRNQPIFSYSYSSKFQNFVAFLKKTVTKTQMQCQEKK